MKTLLLMRHAKSSWGDESLADHDRPLNKRGKRAAPLMGALLEQMNVVPDLIVSSTAKRARKTAEKVGKASGCKRDIVLEPGLYLAAPSTMLEIMQRLPRDTDRVMLVGHNPGTEYMVGYLTGKFQAMPTAAIAQIDFSDLSEWTEIDARVHGQWVNVWRPKEVLG